VGGETSGPTTSSSATQPNPGNPRKPTEQSKETLRNARIPAQARPLPPPPSFQSIGRPPRQHKTQDAAQAPAGAAKSDAEFRNGGSAGAGGQPQRRPAGIQERRLTTTTRARARALARGESVVNAARRPTDTRRRNETGVRIRTSCAGGGGWSEAAERARDGKEGVGDEKKLVGEVGEGYKEGGSHLRPPPLFLSLAPPPPFLSPLLRGCDDEARRLLCLIYGRLPHTATPARVGWGGGFSPYISSR
jgi:hypothetical protein